MANIIIAFLLTLLGAVFFTHCIYFLLNKIRNHNKRIISSNLLSFIFCSFVTGRLLASETLFEFNAILYSLPAQILTYLLYFKIQSSKIDNNLNSIIPNIGYIIAFTLFFFAIYYNRSQV